MARPERFELPTLCFEGRCSIQLSYGRVAEDISDSKAFATVPEIKYCALEACCGEDHFFTLAVCMPSKIPVGHSPGTGTPEI